MQGSIDISSFPDPSSDSIFDCSEEGQKYVAGYLAKHFIDRFPKMGMKTSDISFESQFTSPWIEAVSKGGLVDPSHVMLLLMKSLDEIFLAFMEI